MASKLSIEDLSRELFITERRLDLQVYLIQKRFNEVAYYVIRKFVDLFMVFIKSDESFESFVQTLLKPTPRLVFYKTPPWAEEKVKTRIREEPILTEDNLLPKEYSTDSDYSEIFKKARIYIYTNEIKDHFEKIPELNIIFTEVRALYVYILSFLSSGIPKIEDLKSGEVLEEVNWAAFGPNLLEECKKEILELNEKIETIRT